MAMKWNDLSVLVTGGTGSFGRKFVEIMLERHRPKKLVVFSRDELKQHDMRQVISDEGDSPVRYFIGDVRDVDRVKRAFDGIDVVVHAAALKQVLACEYNPFEAVLTNIMGAKNVIDAAIDQGVKKVLALSTDKAVNPANLYGATKLCAEKLFVQGNSYVGMKNTHFSCTRYGNVVGSRGSVIPLFLSQKSNGSVTVTDPRMTRFWLTVEQGVEFVIRCIEKMHGGEVFVPKIPTMNIMDLVKAIAPECRVKKIGVRPGEKLHEVMVSEEEAAHTLETDDMYVIQPTYRLWDDDKWTEAKPVVDGFSYASNKSNELLAMSDIRNMVEDVLPL